MNIALLLTIIATLFSGIILIVLQIFLSNQNRWFGFILPIISFCIAILLTVTIPYWVRYEVWTRPLCFVVTNIPTAVFSGIYHLCRKQRRKMKDVSKMAIQDL